MLEANDLCLHFGSFRLKDISFTIVKGETFAVIGPSGSGKSCILKLIAGIYKLQGGEILLQGRPIHLLPPEDRQVGLVLQNAALFSNLNVFENIAFGLRIRKVRKRIIDEKVNEYAGLLQIKELLNRNVNTLSGGERQRVALARALIIEPELLLLDEPFSALDRLIHEKLMIEFKKIFQLKKVTVLLVTHDQSEARYLADKIAIIKDGAFLQVDSVSNIFNKPNCRYVADFVNIPNIFEGTAVFNNGASEILLNTLKLKCQTITQYGTSHFCIRPEHITLYPQRPVGVHDNLLEGIVQDCYFGESVQKYVVEVNGMRFTSVGLASFDQTAFEIGTPVYLHIPGQVIHQILLEQKLQSRGAI